MMCSYPAYLSGFEARSPVLFRMVEMCVGFLAEER